MDERLELLTKISKDKIIKSIRREYQSYMKMMFNDFSKNQFDLIIEGSLKITFYKEMFTYLICENLPDEQWIWIYQNSADGKVLETMWKQYERNELSKGSNDFMRQFLDFSKKNEYRRRLKQEAVRYLYEG